MKQFATFLLLALRMFPGLILVLSCAGCVDVRLFSKEPYPPELLQKLSPKDADRNLVSTTMGHPLATKAGGAYWFYASDRERWWLIGSDVVMRDSEWVGIQFDDTGHVIFIEHNDDRDGCLSNGVCQFSGLFSTQPSKISVTAPRIQDAAAKSYQVRSDECAVYLFLERRPLYSVGLVRFSIDGKAQGMVNDKTYLFLTHPRGEISISAYQFKMATTCEGGNRLYVKAEKALDWSWETREDLSPVDAIEGEAEIRARRLALPD